MRFKDEVLEFKKNRILDVAAELFYDRGYAHTKLDDIAERLNVTKPVIYQHISSKAELLAGVSGRTTAFAAVIAQMALDQEGSPTERLARLVHNLVLEVVEGRIYLAVCFREEKHLPEAALKQLQEDRRRFTRSLKALLLQGRATGEFSFEDETVVLQAITGMATWAFTWYRPGAALKPEDLARQMEQLVLTMVAAPSRQDTPAAS